MERTCIVTRETRSPQEMIRFVISPDGHLVPDLKQKLPGRGVWVSATRAMVQEAIKRKAFARGLKTSVTVSSSLTEDIALLLRTALRQSLSFALKAGQLVTGFMQGEALARSGEAGLLIHAVEAAQDGRRKLFNAALAGNGMPIPIIDALDAMELAMALGREDVIHAVVKKGPSAAAVLRRWDALRRYEGENPD
jgi:uncharacterized protein